jgi:hypothetical protein
MMAKFPRVGAVRIAAVSLIAVASIFVLRLSAARADGALPCRDGGPACIRIGFTDAWLKGGTVQLEYSHRHFCVEPPRSGAISECEAGAAAMTPPPSGPIVSNVYLLIPVGFSPPVDTLHCPVAGHCIDHPGTIDLSRLGGKANAVLPAHSIVIEDEEAFQSTWWPMVLVRVKTLDAWNTIAAAKSIAAVDECQGNGGCFEENETNGFLFFQVLGPGMSPQGPP